ncbi:MAG: YicC family protein [Deltaproteobacteria bacterium]|nr:YicC family protein [Deltaproteobacteria bacterium]NND27632.1 YicC family protein [Myxococcales bacterium]MBT8465908.1 YicC family protein [Deltaproteobacteria bacterium]MBT8481617.1 YicC family protein [Deltaproteobacteria bacterium]NNK08623.1 YicC family protein [Myxococcales bacterium]
MRSMTGYGSGRAALGEGQVVLDIRTVNHRFLDVRVRLPSRIQSRTPNVERVIRAQLERGRVDVSARFEGQTLPEPTLDVDRARAVYGELAALRDALNPEEPLPLALLSSVPDLFVVNRRLDEKELERALEQAAAEACHAVMAMRESEGVALAAELRARLGELGASVEAIRTAAPELLEVRRTRLRDRVEALLAGVDVELEPSRLEQEIAVLADRSDIAEELVRLDSHRDQMLELIENSNKAVGKRIDFLLQEMAREANTIGSKVQDGTMTPHVIALKACIEQMREQAQNVL